MRLVTVGPVETPAEFETAIGHGLDQFGPGLKLVMVQLPYGDRMSAFAAPLAGVKAPVLGGTGARSFTERGHAKWGAVAGLLGGDEVEISFASVRALSTDTANKVRRALDGIMPKSAPHLTLLVQVESSRCDGESIAATIRKYTPAHCRHVGGAVTDGATFRGPKLLVNGQFEADAACFAAVSTQHPIQMDVRHGLVPLDGASELSITRISGNVLRTLDGKPALDVYLDELKRLGKLTGAEDNMRVMTAIGAHALGVRTPFGEQLRIRAALFPNFNDRSLLLAGSLPEGSTVRLVGPPPLDVLVGTAREMSDALARQLPAGKGRLVFDCIARGGFGGMPYYQQATRAFVGDGGVPTLGFTSYGEFARGPGLVEGYHNCTAVMAGW